ncbi:TPA: DeoR family transcriptional regulator [Escherichia coli]
MKSAIERRMEIANLVGVRGKVSVGDLTEYFGVSGATIRTDLRFLESMGHIARSKEGANKRGNSSRLTQSFHFFMFEPIFSPVNALNQPI